MQPQGYDAAFVNVVAAALRAGGYIPGTALVRAASIVYQAQVGQLPRWSPFRPVSKATA